MAMSGKRPERRGAGDRRTLLVVALMSSVGTCLSALAGYAGAPTLFQLIACLAASLLAGAGVMTANQLPGFKKSPAICQEAMHRATNLLHAIC
jgi:hypothetical protein